MPQVSTHLHLALKLQKKINIADSDSFLLGNAFPDQWKDSFEKSLGLHYKTDPSGVCNLDEFLKNNRLDNDFNLGYYFHLWVDNEIQKVNVGNISKSDCLIYDMEIIRPAILQLKQNIWQDKKLQAMNNILSLESTPLPLYIPDSEKKTRYDNILEQLVCEFATKIRK